MVIYCDICFIEYSDNSPYAGTNGFLCGCKPCICVPCITRMCVQNRTVIDHCEDGVIIAEDINHVVCCPFCRKEILPSVRSKFEDGYLFTFAMLIKVHRYLKDDEEVEKLREEYTDLLGLDCPF